MGLAPRLHLIRNIYRAKNQIQESSHLLGSSRSYSNVISHGVLLGFACLTKLRAFFNLIFLDYLNKVMIPNRGATPLVCMEDISVINHVTNDPKGLPWSSAKGIILQTTMVGAFESETVAEVSNFGHARFLSTQAKAPAQARQMGALQVSMQSPGIVYEPYEPRKKIPFWKRWFTRSGWRRTKDDIILEMKSAYAIAKLRKSGYSKQKFYNEAFDLYQEISAKVASGEKTSLRKLVTEKMYSALKNEIKQRESKWSEMYWEIVGPAVKIRTLRARLIGVDKNDVNKVFVQLTLEFLTKQKYEAYDTDGNVVAGDKDKEVLVREIWVFEKSLFHRGAYWRLCGRINT